MNYLNERESFIITRVSESDFYNIADAIFTRLYSIDIRWADETEFNRRVYVPSFSSENPEITLLFKRKALNGKWRVTWDRGNYGKRLVNKYISTLDFLQMLLPINEGYENAFLNMLEE